ncbi:MAG TPA: PKD domain-containing protein, partial [Panacibacter sp.]|nr:PKD domain-containing protein [Panacibacter sp.]
MRTAFFYNVILWVLLLLNPSEKVFAQPSADFTSSVTEGCSPLTVQFTDLSAGSPAEWLWDFGNGKISVVQNPKVIFDSAGIYDVSLTVKNGSGEDYKLIKAYIVVNASPVALFNFLPLKGCVPLPVNFTDSSLPGSGNITKWFWNFGDGYTTDSINASVSHTYTATGTYKVKLTVENSKGCRDSLIVDSAIHAGIRPVPYFTANPITDCAKNPFNFINLTTGTVTSWQWDFGDGDTSLRKNPQHFFTDSGKMTIKLYATNNGCVDSFVRTDYIYVKPPYVKIRYNFSCGLPYIRNFQARYVGVSSFYWDFGDGTTSTDPFPVHTYTNTGIFTAKLFSFGPECDFRDTALVYIIDEHPAPSFTAARTKICRYDTVHFTAGSYNPQFIQAFAWDYGDGFKSGFNTSAVSNHVYANAGTYYPSMITRDIQGCYDTIPAPFQIDIYGPKAGFSNSAAVCVNNGTSFTDLTSGDGIHPLVKWIWDYGDGLSETLTAPPFSHTYNNTGIYSIKLKVSDSNGCQDSIEKTNALAAVEKPQTAFTITDTIICIGNQAFFSDISQGQMLGRTWSFGDGTTSDQMIVAHTYKAAGTYTVTLIVGNQDGCSDSLKKTVNVLQLPVVYAGADSVICSGQSLVLHPAGALNYTWATNASLSCTACTNPAANPHSDTKFYVTGTNASGCSATDSLFVTVKQPFTVTPVNALDTVCAGSATQLLASGAEIYNWQPPAGLSNTSTANPVATPASTTVYTVTGRDNKNCFTDSATVTVIVAPYPVFNIIDTSVTLSGGTNYLIRVNNSADIVKWQWSPPTDLSCTSCAQPVAKANKIIQYTAVASNAYGCSVSDKITIKGLCNNEVIFIPNTFSPNGDNVNDRFFPRGSGLYLVKSMRIFNRLGQIVFEKINFAADIESEGWDGKYRS